MDEILDNALEDQGLTTHTMTLNMGPQHPSTHGVLRLILELDGEIVRNVNAVIGYLHRGVEKLTEAKSYHQVIPLTDRLDYTAAMSNNLGYVLAVEKLLGLEIPERAQAIRVMTAEMSRLSGHLLWLGSHAADIGALTVFFYTFRERETLYNLFEMLCGGRMTLSYLRVGGLAYDLPDGFVEKLREFTSSFGKYLKEYEWLLTKNKIWLKRTVGVGVISDVDAVNLCLSGPSLRASGVKWDIRKAEPYSGYEKYDFEIASQKQGDVYARYLVRLEEMRQSIRIINQVVENLAPGPVNADSPKVVLPSKEAVYNSMEGLIHHFKIISEGFTVPEGEVYSVIESPKGELGYYIVSDGSVKPYRVRIRPPSFMNLQSLKTMITGRLIADVTATIGSIDIVLGEIDR